MSNLTDFDTSMGSGGLFTSGSGSSLDDIRAPSGGDAKESEFQDFVALEQQKQQLRSTIHTLTDTCWDKCMGNPGSKLDTKTETCLENCVYRFFDVTVMITNRFASALQRQGGL